MTRTPPCVSQSSSATADTFSPGVSTTVPAADTQLSNVTSFAGERGSVGASPRASSIITVAHPMARLAAPDTSRHDMEARIATGRRKRVEPEQTGALAAPLKRARPEQATDIKGKGKRPLGADSEMESEVERGMESAMASVREAEADGAAKTVFAAPSASAARVTTVAQLLASQSPKPYESTSDNGASVLDWLCERNSPAYELGSELLRVAREIHHQPTLSERMDSVRWLWFHLDKLGLDASHREAIGATLLKCRIVFEFDVAEVEARLDSLADHEKGALRGADSEAAKARFVDALSLARELKHLPQADRMRLMRKVMVHLPALLLWPRMQLLGSLMAQLPSIPNGERAMAFHELISASVKGASREVADNMLRAAAQHLGELKPNHIARALSYLFKRVEMHGLPEVCKVKLMQVCLHSNAAKLRNWLDVDHTSGLADARTLVDLVDVAARLDAPSLELAAPFLAAHVARSQATGNGLCSLAYAKLVRMIFSLPSARVASALNDLLDGMEARSSAPRAIVDELPFVVQACHHLRPADAMNLLMGLIKRMPAASSPRRHFVTVQVSAQAACLPEPMRALVRDALAHRLLLANGG